jgi:hypothetical protein
VIVHGHVEHVSLRDPAHGWFLERLREIYPSYDDWGHLDNPYWVLQPVRMYARRAMDEAA